MNRRDILEQLESGGKLVVLCQTTNWNIGHGVILETGDEYPYDGSGNVGKIAVLLEKKRIGWVGEPSRKKAAAKKKAVAKKKSSL